MTILIDESTKIIVQGITGKEGLFHAKRMLATNTHIVAGVTPGKGGGWVLDGKIPVFDTVSSAAEMTGANTSIIFVPYPSAADAILEAVDARIPVIICISEGIPVHDMMLVKNYLLNKSIRLIGPNSPGLISPGKCNAGIIPEGLIQEGNIGLISRSGTLMYEIMAELNRNGFGVSTCVGLGGDAIIGTEFTEILDLFEQDSKTDQIVIIGEIGGSAEERAANFISKYITKSVVAYVAGTSSPPNRRMGHAGAIIEGRAGSASEKIRVFKEHGIRVAAYPEEIPALIK